MTGEYTLIVTETLSVTHRTCGEVIHSWSPSVDEESQEETNKLIVSLLEAHSAGCNNSEILLP